MTARLIAAALIAANSGFALASQTPLTEVAQLSARGDHACVVTTGGGAKCWGSNYYGQLGAGPGGQYDYRTAATDVTGLTSGVLEIAASTGSHTCAIVTGGGIKCWGLNDKGQLGDGTTTNRPEPADVVGLPWPAVGLTAAIAHTCAFSADGAVACWGDNSRGQLGDGTTTQRLAPAVVPGLSGVVEMSAAVAHTCALTAAGAMKCWGANYNGALGDGTRTDQPSPVDVSGLASGVTAIATGGAPSPSFVFGDYSTTCAIAAGAMKCWGGSTMTGSFYGNAAPVDVAGAPNGLAQITMGGSWFHTFGASGFWVVQQTCVVTSTGDARCWGSNYCGMLGDGLEPDCTWNYGGASPPGVAVAGLSSGVVSVSSTTGFSCALLADGTVRCWGSRYGSTALPMLAGTTPQTLFLQAPYYPVTVGGSQPVTASSSGASGQPIVLTSLTPGTCSASGLTVTGVAAGTCTIAANQAGSEFYDPAPQVTVTLEIDPHIAQIVTFTQLPASLVVNGVANVAATASSGRPVAIAPQYTGYCTVSGNVVTGVAVGSCPLRAYVPGDSTYAAGEALASIPVGANTGTAALQLYRFGGGAGRVTSSAAGIDCGQACAGNFAATSAVTLTAFPEPGSQFDAWGGACAGMGNPCIVTMDAAKTVTARFDSDLTRLSNLSTRGRIDPGVNFLIAGFVIGGTQRKSVLIRAKGFSLLPYGIDNPAWDPKIHLYAGPDQVTENNDWQQEQPNLSTIVASGLQPGHFSEAAIYATLSPGAYTAIVAAQGSQGGISIVEVFEMDRADQPLINISTRGHVGAGGDVMIVGFVIEGVAPQTVAILGRGPSLAAYGVANPLANPHLQLIRMSDQSTIGMNDNWKDAANAAAITASGFAPSDDNEAAILITLEPGAYTAIMSGVAGTGGNGIVEVYKAGN